MLGLLSIGVCVANVCVCLSPMGWPCIYKVYCSQFKVCKDSLLLDEILLTFIEIDIEGKRLLRIIPLSYLMRPDL